MLKSGILSCFSGVMLSIRSSFTQVPFFGVCDLAKGIFKIKFFTEFIVAKNCCPIKSIEIQISSTENNFITLICSKTPQGKT